MDETTKTILLNKDVIAIDQDALGKQGFRVYRKDGLEAFKKPLSGNRVAIAFLNRNSTDNKITASYKDLELDPEISYSVYDVWKHTALGQANGTLSADLKPHECQVFVLSPSESK
jgi:alpha-galactosidase